MTEKEVAPSGIELQQPMTSVEGKGREAQETSSRSSGKVDRKKEIRIGALMTLAILEVGKLFNKKYRTLLNTKAGLAEKFRQRFHDSLRNELIKGLTLICENELVQKEGEDPGLIEAACLVKKRRKWVSRKIDKVIGELS